MAAIHYYQGEIARLQKENRELTRMMQVAELIIKDSAPHVYAALMAGPAAVAKLQTPAPAPEKPAKPLFGLARVAAAFKAANIRSATKK